MLENSFSDIFTEIDESVFYDGSIDPMGLRIIWTSLGNRIFHNRLNTISTNIKFYTLNLFHHYLVFNCWQRRKEDFINLLGIPPYNNKNDLEDGIVIFLECLMAHALLKERENLPEKEVGVVPGIYKLQTLKLKGDKRANFIDVNRRPGILERHHLLGIHGRHKGPFLQMEIFGQKDYYLNTEVWEEAGKLFATEPWKQLGNQLMQIIENKILNAVHLKNQSIRVKADESILTKQLTSAYLTCMKKNVYNVPSLVEFWEHRLGLHDGEAAIIYRELKDNLKSCTEKNWQFIFKKAGFSQTNEVTVIKAIIAIEPLLTCIDQSINRLLVRGTTEINEELTLFVSHWLKQPSIQVDAMQKFLSNEYFEKDALIRLKKLILIYKNAVSNRNTSKFIHNLIEYHQQLMKDRNNLPWITISNNGAITQHRSYNYSLSQKEELKNNKWINGYYLPTVYLLYNGLRGNL